MDREEADVDEHVGQHQPLNTQSALKQISIGSAIASLVSAVQADRSSKASKWRRIAMVTGMVSLGAWIVGIIPLPRQNSRPRHLE